MDKTLDLTSFVRIEDMTEQNLLDIKEIITYYASQLTTWINMRIAGSYCFNIPDHVPQDMDVVLIISEDVKVIRESGIGYDLVNNMAHKEMEMRKANHFNKKVQIMCKNESEFNSCGTDSPYYDLDNLTWARKKPYDVYNKIWKRINNAWCFIDRIIPERSHTDEEDKFIKKYGPGTLNSTTGVFTPTKTMVVN